MHAQRSVEIAAAPGVIYELAQDVARWPAILPHYRWVKVLREEPQRRVIEMAARRDWIPVRWTAVQTLDAQTPRIGFTHVSGWTKGMSVAWLFEPIGDRTRVTITHDLERAPWYGEWIGRRVIGDFFIQSIAGRTLARMKEIAEAMHG